MVCGMAGEEHLMVEKVMYCAGSQLPSWFTTVINEEESTPCRRAGTEFLLYDAFPVEPSLRLPAELVVRSLCNEKQVRLNLVFKLARS